MSDTPKLEEAADGGLRLTACSPSLDSLKGLKGKEYRKAWNKLHRDKCRQASKEWRKRNPEKVRTTTRKRLTAYYDKNPGKRESLRGRQKYYSGYEKAKFKGQPWGVVEDCMVMDSGEPDKVIAEKLGRSVKAVEIRRVRLKKQNLLERPYGCDWCKPDTFRSI